MVARALLHFVSISIKLLPAHLQWKLQLHLKKYIFQKICRSKTIQNVQCCSCSLMCKTIHPNFLKVRSVLSYLLTILALHTYSALFCWDVHRLEGGKLDTSKKKIS